MRWLSVMRLARLVRSNVDCQLSPDGRNRETGAVASIVAILFGTGVLLGLGALVIDTGSLLYERRQLQNGADAAALSIAKTCAEADKAHALNSALPLCAAPDISDSSSSSLVGLAGKNAADGLSDIASVCESAALSDSTKVGSNPSAFPTQCAPPATPGLVECPNTSSTAKYVEVRTSTRSADPSAAHPTILPPILAQTLAGGGYSGETVKACARAGWGPGKTTGFVLPIAMSYCEWKAATGANPEANPPIAGTYVTPPDYSSRVAYGYTDRISSPQLTPLWPTATEHEIYTASSVPALGCTTWDGHVTPGNFSAVVQTQSCSATAGEWMVGNTGNDSPCSDAELLPYRGKLILVPLFNCVASSTAPLTPTTDCQAPGNEANYHITGYATFYLTGWQFSGTNGGYDKSIKDSHQLCVGPGTTGNSGRCLSGWFTREVIGVGQIDDTDAPDFGTTVIQALG